MHCLPIRIKFIPLAVAALMGGLSATSFAAPLVTGTLATGQITLDANYSLPQSGPVTSGLAPQGTISQSTNGADLYLYKSDISNNNVFFHTYGFTGTPTYFGARASGEGSFSATTYSRYSRTFTNNSLLDQLYNFAFNVSDGQLAITGSGAGIADLMLRVNVTKSSGTTTVAQDHTTLSQSATALAPSCTPDDVGSGLGALSGYMTCSAGNSVFGANGPYNVSLGTIAAGETFTLDYDIIATVSGDLSAANGYGGYGQDMNFNGCGLPGQLLATNQTNQTAVVQEGGCNAPISFPGMAIARSGDPFNGPQFATGGPSDTTTANFQVSAANAIPEPGSIALMGLALAGLAATRRKKKPDSA